LALEVKGRVVSADRLGLAVRQREFRIWAAWVIVLMAGDKKKL
jgi:hypothetical protein